MGENGEEGRKLWRKRENGGERGGEVETSHENFTTIQMYNLHMFKARLHTEQGKARGYSGVKASLLLDASSPSFLCTLYTYKCPGRPLQ